MAVACMSTLSACTVDYAQSASELTARVGSTSYFKSNNYQVSRSAAAVSQSLRAGANKCLNQRTTGQIYGGSHMGAPILHNTVTDYTTTVRNNGRGGIEMAVRMTSRGFRISMDEPEGGEIIFTANVTPSGGGARVVDAWMDQNLFTPSDPIADGVRAWAEGTSSACPEMPR